MAYPGDYSGRKPGARKERKCRKTHIKKHVDQDLIDEYHDTMKYFSKNGPPSHLIPYPILYDITTLEDQVDPPIGQMAEIQVINADTLDTALEFSAENVLILSMASRFKAGGGVGNGRTAQEECIFRRSNAFQTHESQNYPLGHYEVIYSPQVIIIKDSDYEMLKKPQVVSMLAVHAIKNPKLNGDEYKNADDKALMELKIESIFKIAIKHKHQILVLGALGCGAYRHAPIAVREIFKQNLAKYRPYFKKIVFAVLSRNDNNFELFKELEQV